MSQGHGFSGQGTVRGQGGGQGLTALMATSAPELPECVWGRVSCWFQRPLLAHVLPPGLPNTLPPTRHPLTVLPREPDPGQTLTGRPVMAATAHALAGRRAGNLGHATGFPRPTGSRGALTPPTLSQRPVLLLGPLHTSQLVSSPPRGGGHSPGEERWPPGPSARLLLPWRERGLGSRGEEGNHWGSRAHTWVTCAPLHMSAPRPWWPEKPPEPRRG